MRDLYQHEYDGLSAIQKDSMLETVLGSAHRRSDRSQSYKFDRYSWDYHSSSITLTKTLDGWSGELVTSFTSSNLSFSGFPEIPEHFLHQVHAFVVDREGSISA